VPREAGRTAWSVGFTGEALEADIAAELARQQTACIEYARKAGLVPV
jgi:hypothetical protein